MLGETEEALARLTVLHDRGVLRLEDLERDPALDGLRGDARFEAFLDDLYDRLEAEKTLWLALKNSPRTREHQMEVIDSCLSGIG